MEHPSPGSIERIEPRSGIVAIVDSRASDKPPCAARSSQSAAMPQQQ
jgi:hypothetical protein